MQLKKQYESGAATNYITRNRALKKLQLTLKDFRRLCILKGIFPHDPLHKKKVNKGSSQNHIYYYAKDITYLASEPIIEKFREKKIFLKKLAKAKAKKEDETVKRLNEHRPRYELQRIVKERYPKFGSALRDLDDALCLCFAFAVFPNTFYVTSSIIAECRRLTAEFCNFIIESHSLTKVFISIKGIYYQAEVDGEKLTWVVGHDRGVGRIKEVDFSVMAIFAEFYIALLESVNCHLYKSIGLYYPPKLAYSKAQDDEVDEEEAEKIYSLAVPLAKDDTVSVEAMPDLTIDEGASEGLAAKLKDEQVRRSLFANCWFWLNREAPKEVLAVIVRSCGGMVSWEGCPGGLFNENDSRITHQVVDRPLVKNDINRCYIQPQWVVDCFNMRKRLPVEKYLPGATLPPHLSPFTTDVAGQYIPEERIEQLKESGVDVTELVGETTPAEEVQKAVKKKKEKGMHVEPGKTYRKNKQMEMDEKGHELKLREMMIAKRHRRVYHKIKRGIKRQAREVRELKQKRAKLEESNTNDRVSRVEKLLNLCLLAYGIEKCGFLRIGYNISISATLDNLGLHPGGVFDMFLLCEENRKPMLSQEAQ
uniref:Pescadillo homolog n=1 Tax=Syphacia muris TaxID=451379 RepID=A0A0N5AF18_9BILA